MKNPMSEKALAYMGQYFRSSGIEAYKSDFVHDRVLIAKNEPEVFIWVIRDCGTHIYPLDRYAMGYEDRDEFYAYLRGIVGTLGFHAKHERVLHTFAFIEGDVATISIDDAIWLVKSYLPAGDSYGEEESA